MGCRIEVFYLRAAKVIGVVTEALRMEIKALVTITNLGPWRCCHQYSLMVAYQFTNMWRIHLTNNLTENTLER